MDRSHLETRYIIEDNIRRTNSREGGLWATKNSVIMRPSSLGGGRIMRRTLSVCLSVRPVIVFVYFTSEHPK